MLILASRSKWITVSTTGSRECIEERNLLSNICIRSTFERELDGISRMNFLNLELAWRRVPHVLASRRYTLRSVMNPLNLKRVNPCESQGFENLSYLSSRALTELNLQSWSMGGNLVHCASCLDNVLEEQIFVRYCSNTKALNVFYGNRRSGTDHTPKSPDVP
jgi:hypothetical protein